MKMHELESIVNDLRQCGEVILNAADMLGAYYEESRQLKAAAQAKASQTAATSKQPQASEAQQPDFTEMRRLLTAYAQAGYSHEIRDIIEKYGAKKLSELNIEAYGQVLKEIEAIANPRGGADE